MPEWISTAVIIVVIAVICVFAVISYVRKLSKGCCGTAADIERKLEAKQGDYRYSNTVEVGGMTCEKCAVRVANGFNRQKGISAEVSLKEGTVKIRSEEPLSEVIIRKTIIELGYSAGEINTQNVD